MEDWDPFFLQCLVEFTREVITRAWSFLCLIITNLGLNFFNGFFFLVTALVSCVFKLLCLFPLILKCIHISCSALFHSV